MNEGFGVSPGKVDDLASSGLTNEFATISNNNLGDALSSDRVQPRQLGSGVLRGTQRIVNTDGSYITLGVIPDTNGEFGIAFFDANANLISKDQGAAKYQYDDSGDQVSVSGELSDGDYGLQFSDGTVTTTIKAGSFKQNDGTNDRIFMGDE